MPVSHALRSNTTPASMAFNFQHRRYTGGRSNFAGHKTYLLAAALVPVHQFLPLLGVVAVAVVRLTP